MAKSGMSDWELDCAAVVEGSSMGRADMCWRYWRRQTQHPMIPLPRYLLLPWTPLMTELQLFCVGWPERFGISAEAALVSSKSTSNTKPKQSYKRRRTEPTLKFENKNATNSGIILFLWCTNGRFMMAHEQHIRAHKYKNMYNFFKAKTSL